MPPAVNVAAAILSAVRCARTAARCLPRRPGTSPAPVHRSSRIPELDGSERGRFVQRSGGHLDGVPDVVRAGEGDEAGAGGGHGNIVASRRRKEETRPSPRPRGYSTFAIREYRMNCVTLKPQDIAVVLKLCAYGSKRPPYFRMAFDLSMSPSEVHAAVKRAQNSRLLHPAELDQWPNISALLEFLIHGLKYAFPAERGEPTRGVPTSYAAEPLRAMIASGHELPPVWPFEKGSVRGIAFEPLYKNAPVAALRDPVFYEYLALTDALRDGRARERKLAEDLIVKRLRYTSYER